MPSRHPTGRSPTKHQPGRVACQFETDGRAEFGEPGACSDQHPLPSAPAMMPPPRTTRLTRDQSSQWADGHSRPRHPRLRRSGHEGHQEPTEDPAEVIDEVERRRITLRHQGSE